MKRPHLAAAALLATSLIAPFVLIEVGAKAEPQVAEFALGQSVIRVSAAESGFVVLETRKGGSTQRARFSPASVERWAETVSERLAPRADAVRADSGADSISRSLDVASWSPSLAGWDEHTFLFHDTSRTTPEVHFYLMDAQATNTVRLDLSRARAAELVAAMRRAGSVSRQLAYERSRS